MILSTHDGSHRACCAPHHLNHWLAIGFVVLIPREVLRWLPQARYAWHDWGNDGRTATKVKRTEIRRRRTFAEGGSELHYGERSPSPMAATASGVISDCVAAIVLASTRSWASALPTATYLLSGALALPFGRTAASGRRPVPCNRGVEVSLASGGARLRTFWMIVGCTMAGLVSVAYPETAWAWSQPSSFQLPPAFFSSGDNGQLTGVSCTSRHACTAVGSSDEGGALLAEGGALLERWNGVDWSLQAAAPTVGVSVPYLGLGSISCVSNTYCVAVGTADDSYQHSLVESWNGSAWSVQPSGSGSLGGELGTVSCSSAVACMAAGANNLDGSPLALRWNGRAWSGQAVNVDVVALSCFSRTCARSSGNHSRTSEPSEPPPAAAS